MTQAHFAFMLGAMLRSLRIIVELLAGIIGILAVLGFFALWSLSLNPFNSKLLTPYLVSGIESYLPDAKANIQHTTLSWDNIDRALVMHADGVVIKKFDDTSIAEIPNIDLHVSVIGLLLGQLLPIEFVIDHPQIHLERRKDNKVYFGGLSSVSDSNDDPLSATYNFLNVLPKAHFLRNIEIKRAVLEILDQASNKTWSISIPEVNLKRKSSNLYGHIYVDLSQADNAETAEAHYVYDDNEKRHHLSFSFDNIVPAELAGGHPEVVGIPQLSFINIPLTGDVDASFDQKLKLMEGSVRFQGDSGTLNIPAVWAKPRQIHDIDFEASYDNTTNAISIPTATVNFGGPSLDLKLQGTKSTQPDRDIDFSGTLRLQNWPLDQYQSLWPSGFIPTVANWISGHMSKGSFDDGHADFKGSLKLSDLANADITSAQGKITASHVNVKYIDGMPLVEDVKAIAEFDTDKMSVQIVDGGVGNLHIKPFTLVMYDFQKDTQRIYIPLKLSGPVPDILVLIDNPPLRYTQAIGLKTDQIIGNADVEVDLNFPLIQSLVMSDIDVKANATIANFNSNKLLNGVDITQGQMTISVDNKGFVAKGPIQLNTIPFNVSWIENFNASSGKPDREIEANGLFKDDQFKAWGVDLFNGSRGLTKVSIKLKQNNGKDYQMTGAVDLTGAEIHFDQMNWRKPINQTAQLKFEALIPDEGDISIKSIQLRGPLANIKGEATIGQDGTIKDLKLDPFVLGRTDTTLYVSRPDGVGQVLRFEAYGNALDISGLRGGKDPEHSAPQPKEYELKVDKLYTNNNNMITQAQGFAIRDLQGWSEISLHGLADGDHKLDVDLRPTDDGRTFDLTCDDFGKALKGLGFSDSVQNGKLEIHGKSLPNQPRVIEGTVKISDFEVRNLPAMVVLLNATSPFGFMGILTDSTSFSSMRGRFAWQVDTILLKDIEAAGSSVGMNIKGKVDMNTGEAKLSGTLVPFSSVNGILGSIPLIGDILTGGGGGGVLAVAYSINGNLAEPKVSVNPVSLLAPGFLRTLFFGSDDEVLNSAADEPLPAEATKDVAPSPTTNISPASR
jgi:hypothetical protein